MHRLEIGKKVPVVISRNGKMKNLMVVIEKSEDSAEAKESPSDSKASDSRNYVLGMIFGDITSNERSKYKLDKSFKGVIVKSVKRGSSC